MSDFLEMYAVIDRDELSIQTLRLEAPTTSPAESKAELGVIQ